MVKEGIFTGCSTCLDICPVGADFDPSRRATLLNQIRRTGSRDSVGVEHRPEQLSIREPLGVSLREDLFDFARRAGARFHRRGVGGRL